MKKLLYSVFFTALTIVVGAQELPEGDDPVLMTIDGQPVYQSEFEYIFKKNNRDAVVTKESLDEYIDLFINFKLKVQAADDLGMDTIAKFERELLGYRAQLAKPYLIDNDKVDALVLEAYDRTQWEIHASHILVSCDPGSSPEDSAAAYDRALMFRDSILNGADFGAVASGKGGSDDPSAVKNQGDLGFFTAFKMVYPFENAAYETEVGEISMPVRTRFGYHIIWVQEKRPARGEVNVAHIMVQSKDGDADSLKVLAEQKIREIYDLVIADESSFAELAVQYSDDKQSGKNGGDLGWFGTGKMVAEFDSASFAMENIGDISVPFTTPFGWHIITLLDKRGVPTLEEAETKIKAKVSKDARAQISKVSFIQKLKEMYGFEETQSNLKYISSALDTMVFHAQWEAPENKYMSKALFTFADSSITVGDFAAYIMEKQRKEEKQALDKYVQKRYSQFVNATLENYEDSQLETKYPEFKMLMKEYRDGILLFELTEEKVWGKAMKDTVGLQEFYEANKTEFMWDSRVNISIFKCKDEKIAKKAHKWLNKGKADDYVVDKLNEDSQLNLFIENGTYATGANEIADDFAWEEGLSEWKEINGQIVFVRINEVLEPMPKELDEARGLVTARYQKYLEEEWIKELRSTYEVIVNEEVLYSIE